MLQKHSACCQVQQVCQVDKNLAALREHFTNFIIQIWLSWGFTGCYVEEHKHLEYFYTVFKNECMTGLKYISDLFYFTKKCIAFDVKHQGQLFIFVSEGVPMMFFFCFCPSVLSPSSILDKQAFVFVYRLSLTHCKLN